VERVQEILAEAKRLAVEYYRLTGKPLGVTGEVAEYVAAGTLGLKLAPQRTLFETELGHAHLCDRERTSAHVRRIIHAGNHAG
jgi:hypothetical protein